MDDLEVKDAHIIFNSIWNDLLEEYAKDKLIFPKEIIWLNGAPGAGKGTNTNFIMRYRGLTAPPVVVSDLLNTPESKAKKDAGFLVEDKEVVKILLKKLLDPIFKFGVVIDGFPRTKVQVECVKLLHSKMKKLEREYRNTEFGLSFKKPHFHILVLFVDENESIKRQIERGEKAIIHNKSVQDSGVGTIVEVRKTDLDPKACSNRYKTFKNKTYNALKNLREIFFYHFINAHGSIETVRKRIDSELKYQGSLELEEDTYVNVSSIPTSDELIKHSRQELVDRLDSYQKKSSNLFVQILSFIRDECLPIIKVHALSGKAIVNSNSELLSQDKAVNMLIDILSERGYYVTVEKINTSVENTNKSKANYFKIDIKFKSSKIRRG